MSSPSPSSAAEHDEAAAPRGMTASGRGGPWLWLVVLGAVMVLPVVARQLISTERSTRPDGGGIPGVPPSSGAPYVWGIVLDVTGRPVAGATVRARPWRLPGPAWLRAAAGQPEGPAPLAAEARSGPAGLFLLPLPKGRYDVIAGAPGFALLRLAAERSPHPGMVVDLERGYAIRGQAPDLPAGSRLYAEPLGDVLRRPTVYTEASPDGRFELLGLGLGDYRVVAETPSGDRAVLDEVPAGTEDLDITVLPRRALLGRVLSAADAQPTSGARVWVAGSGIWPPRSTTSDGSGRFRFDGLPAGWYVLRASAAPNLVSGFLEGVRVSGGDKHTEQSLIVAAERRVALRLRHAGSGLAVSDAALTVAPELPAVLAVRVSTDIQGLAQLGPLPPGRYEVDLRGPGVAPALGVGFTVPPPASAAALGSSLVISVELPAPGQLSGRVVDLEARPVRHARCYAEAPGVSGAALGRAGDATLRARLRRRMGAGGVAAGDGAGPTDAQGRFRFGALPQGTYRVLCQHPGFQPGTSVEVPVPSGGAASGVEVVLAPGGQLSGRVVNLEGDPVRAAVVRFANQAGASTDRQGRFTLFGVSGDGTLSVQADGYAPVQRSLTVDPAQPHVPLVVTLDGSLRPLRGHVLAPDGGDQAGAELLLTGTQDLEQHTVSGPTGAFEFASPPPPPWELTVTATGAAIWTRRLDNSADPLLVQLAAGGTLRLELLEAVTFEPLSTARVTLQGPRSLRWRGRLGDGFVAVDQLPAGVYSARVDAAGHLPVLASRLRVREGHDAAPVRLLLPLAGALAGVVRDVEGRPVAKALVTAEPLAGLPQDTPREILSVRTGRAGRFVLPTLPDGMCRLRVQASGYVASSQQERVFVGERYEGVEVSLVPAGADGE